MTATQKTRLVAAAMGLGLVWLPAAASAQQAASAPAPSKGYVEAVANSSFGNVTSQAYGGEFGYTVWRDAQVYADFGQVRNAATASLSAAAQTIANALTQLQPGAVSYEVKQPVTYFSAGLRFPFTTQGKLIPYALAGFGVAQVKKDVTYTITGGNVNDYVTLGDDLSGTSTSPLLNVGAGVSWAAYGQLTVDFQFRVMHVFSEGEAMNIGRAGVGIGVRF